MKVFLLFGLFFSTIYLKTSFGQKPKIELPNSHHGVSLEFLGTGTGLSLQYFHQRKIGTTNYFSQFDAIVGYHSEYKGYHRLARAYNFSTSINFGYQHITKRSFLLGLGLGYDKGRISFSQELTNKSVVTYLRLKYSRHLLNERLLLSVSLVFGYKVFDYYNGLDPAFNKRVEEFKYWLLPGFSIGYCFGKKYFQKEKIGTE